MVGSKDQLRIVFLEKKEGMPRVEPVRRIRPRQAKEVSQKELEREERLADALCRKEEEELSSAESLYSEDSEDSEEESEEYESDFIDDSEVNPDEVAKTAEFVRKWGQINRTRRRAE